MTSKQKSPADQFIFQRHTPMPTEPSGHAESPPLNAELAMTDSETKYDKESPRSMLEIKMKANLDQTMVNKMKARMDQTLVML
ncbi:hypothetical protein Tco_0182522 [Tanacetum coccineum]